MNTFDWKNTTPLNLRKFIITCSVFASCTAIRPAISESFEKGATKYHVKGLQGWMVNQKLSLGDYSTSGIRRGWDFSSSVQYTKFGISPEEAILKVFDIDTDKQRQEQKSKFQYVLENGTQGMEIYGTEKFSEKNLVYKSNNPFIGDGSKTLRYEYSFTAIMVPLTGKQDNPWSLVLIHRYDSKKDTARRLLDRPYVEEEGYATDGIGTIALRPVQAKQAARVLSGYELQQDGNPVAFIDLLNGDVLIGNDQPARMRLVLSSIATALLVRQLNTQH